MFNNMFNTSWKSNLKRKQIIKEKSILFLDKLENNIGIFGFVLLTLFLGIFQFIINVFVGIFFFGIVIYEMIYTLIKDLIKDKGGS